MVEVSGPLQAGDRLVTEGVERLRPFQEVAILAPPPGGDKPAPGGDSTSAIATDTTEESEPHQPAGG